MNFTEHNIKNKVKRGRPSKNKIEKDPKLSEDSTKKNDNVSSSIFSEEDFNDNIRAPDKIKKDKLIDYTNYYDYDEEIMRIIELSREEYYNNNLKYIESNIDDNRNDLIMNSNYQNELNKEENNKDKWNISEENNCNDSGVSTTKFNEKLLKQDKELFSEEQNLKEKENEMNKRINSLPNFIKMIKKINLLCFTSRENEVKIYIEENLNDYFDLKIDQIIIEDELLYKDIYSIIDSYYLIPKTKNYKKYAISFEEDQILRSLFLNKNNLL